MSKRSTKITIEGISVAEVIVKVRKKSKPRFSESLVIASNDIATPINVRIRQTTMMPNDGVLNIVNMLSSLWSFLSAAVLKIRNVLVSLHNGTEFDRVVIRSPAQENEYI